MRPCRAFFRLRHRQQAVALRLFAGELAGPPDGVGLFALALFRGLFIGAMLFQFPENAFPLHLFLEDTKSLIDVIVSNENLHRFSDPMGEQGATRQGWRSTGSASGRRQCLGARRSISGTDRGFPNSAL